MNFAQARRNMVDCQLRTFDITDRAVLAAMGEVPRERFMPAGREDFAYSDGNIPLGDGTLLAPMVLGRMIQALKIEARSSVLDVATGFGYTAAVLHALGAAVTGLESDGTARAEATKRLAAIGFGLPVQGGALPAGYPAGAPYDAILINGAVELRPDVLLAQLKVGGRLVCLHRDGRSGRAVLYVRAAEGYGLRPLFDAAAPVLPAFAKVAAFSF